MKYEIMNEKEVVERELGLLFEKTFKLEEDLFNYSVRRNEE